MGYGIAITEITTVRQYGIWQMRRASTTLAFFMQAHPPPVSRLQHCWPVSQFANVDDENEPLDVNSVDPYKNKSKHVYP